jgi:hypothetical protein
MLRRQQMMASGTGITGQAFCSQCYKTFSNVNHAWSKCYKNTALNYHSNFDPTFSRVKRVQNITAILG